MAVIVLPGAVARRADARSRSPRLSARSALLVEASTGTPVFERAALRIRPIASTTKLMTALVTLQRARLSDVLTVPRYSAIASESQLGLKPGERLRVADLLRALLLPSAGDAAETLAVGVAGSRPAFVRAMNREARRLRLFHTHYTTPVGLDDPRNYSNAFDLVRLTRVLRRYAWVRRVVDEPRAMLQSGAHPRVVVNRNTLVRLVPWVDGVKTGHTNAAGYVLVGSGTRRGVTWISVVLGTPSEAARDADTLALLRYGIANFALTHPVHRNQVVARAAVAGRPGERVALVADRTFTGVARRGSAPRLVVQAPRTLAGPRAARSRVGTVEVRTGGRVVARVRLLTDRMIPPPLAPLGARGAGEETVTLVLVVALLGGSAWALRRRRAARRRAERGDVETA
jgi:D-alanyl-D-alanine carboxypeptidase (penicillin-binding protein 5/6)